ncbi:MAG: DNA polymerase IV, partial [Acidimicrobiales bacterium]|nr:DNA polymerase IV [Acidimicrobiales bacterium]
PTRFRLRSGQPSQLNPRSSVERQRVEQRGFGQDLVVERDWVLHVDLDQFLAAVEIRRDPSLKGLPLVVGGDGNPDRPRQVVATASYEAREHGVHSGMPLATARRRCPDAVFLPSDRDAYDAASEEVMAVLRSFPVVVEVWGWDEAFVGVHTDDPARVAEEIRRAVLARTGLSCAVGIGETRLGAKTATGRAKPGGIARMTRAEWMDDMATRPVGEIWGIGPKISARLAKLGIETVRDLAWSDTDALAAEFGPRIGPSLRVLGLGGDERPIVDEPWVAKSKSHETTFEHDITDPDRMAAEVDAMARRLTTEVAAEGRLVTHVSVKVRTSTFWTRTKISKLPSPTTDPATVADAGGLVLSRFEIERPVRLLGVRVVLDQPSEGPTGRQG